MKVYVVKQGERHEGGSVTSIHAQLESAIRKAEHVMDECRSWCQWEKQANGAHTWWAGCDYVSVEEYEVQP